MPLKPSWTRWPPNCCETCTSWEQVPDPEWGEIEYVGRCNSPKSINSGDLTDSRYRCPSFQRKPDAPDTRSVPEAVADNMEEPTRHDGE